ncbi:RanBP2-type zinc finger protein [Zea mays]|uniref:RanBP2-type zinc finger protein n=2 Tax=Zea mays TaxID=4577 RepID=A0A1D6KJ68_MAIZE|nr:RanBP2-type zinc finger protein [Zea mays]ONM03008.1 RanBP2-type zinc finger protein [Zea mays]
MLLAAPLARRRHHRFTFSYVFSGTAPISSFSSIPPVDRRSQSAGKRARTDGSRREDDWVCPSCKNVNFAFRTTCNMRSCNQSRPADHTKAMQTPPHYPTSGGYMGPGTPPSMYLGGGAPPYGSSMFNGPAVTRYGIPQFPGGSAYSYGYGGPIPMGSPYGPMQIAGPTPYSGGTMMTAGGMYGIPMDRYGPIPAGPGPMGTRAGSYSDEGSQKKPAGAGRDNDWECPNCHNINFGFRTVCNMRKCNTPRPANQGSKSDGLRGSKAKMPEGSWKCEQCNNINYPFRTKCNRPQCGAEKPSQTNNVNGSATDQDNQFLPCNITKLLSKLRLLHEFQDSSEQTDLPCPTAGSPTLRMSALSELQNSLSN